MNLLEEKIEKYAARHSVPESGLLKELAVETYRNTEIPQMQVGHLEGSFLKMLVKLTGAKRVLEIGTFTGYSALCMAEALPEDGELITCDLNPETSAIAKRYFEKSGWAKKIHLKLGPALQTLRALSGPFDFAFIDADKENYTAYWDAVIPKMKSGGLVAVDNVLWSGRVLAPKDPTDHAVHSFNKHALKDPRVELVMLTVRDGLTLALIKGDRLV